MDFAQPAFDFRLVRPLCCLTFTGGVRSPLAGRRSV